MDVHWVILLVAVAITRVQGDLENDPLCFPAKFYFGVATAAYQIEGAWNVSGKGESIWDRYTHTNPERVFDHTTGDVADDSYYRFKDDVGLMTDLGVSFYRFSISWPRILPDGMGNNINKDGIRYYNELIDELGSKGIQPVVTMYHWDLPQTLQDLGGWTNPIMVDYFVDYARVLFDQFGQKVKTWITFNEPLSFCGDGYGGNDAPGGRSSGFEDYLCGHNVLIAHGRVYRMYEKEYKGKQHGSVGITLCIDWMEPNSTSVADRTAAETSNQFFFGWFANPIFSKRGDYPPIMRKRVDEISRQQGFSCSRLPTFTREEVNTIRVINLFLVSSAVPSTTLSRLQNRTLLINLVPSISWVHDDNHYTTYMVKATSGKAGPVPSFYDDVGVNLMQRDDWPKSNSTWLRIVPWGFRKALNWIHVTYNSPMMVITENGVSLEPGLHDPKRVQYINSYLKALHAAIVKDGCNVVGYTYWSLIDNFEWMRGYSERFGLYEVDYSSPNKTRTARLSASLYSLIAKTKCIPQDYHNLIYSTHNV